MSIVINGYTGEVTSKVNSSNDWTVGVLNVNGDEFEVLMKEYSKKPLVCEESGEFLTTEDLEFHSDLYVRTDGCVLSRQVAINNYYQCQRCQRWEYEDRGVYTDDDCYFCDSCAEEEVIKCDDCGRAYSYDYFENHGLSGEDNYGSDIHYCEHCEDNYTRCEDCGCIISYDEVYCDDDGYNYCESCYYEHQSEFIHSYHFDGSQTDYGFKWLDDGSRTEDPVLGTELEVEVDDKNSAAEDVINTMGDDQIVLCEDGSLDGGFEIVSCPANLRNITEVMAWKDAMDDIKRYGGTSHDNGHCGHHIHTDRGYFIGSNLTKEEVEAAYLTVIANNAEWIKNFSRRQTWHYCKMNHEDESGDKPVKQYKIENTEGILELWNKKLGKTRCDRYQAVNLTRTDTIELRFFRGTLNYETFLANEQFADMIARQIKSCDTLEDAVKINLHTFKEMAIDRGYNEFLNYLDRRGIIDGTEDVYREEIHADE